MLNLSPKESTHNVKTVLTSQQSLKRSYLCTKYYVQALYVLSVYVCMYLQFSLSVCFFGDVPWCSYVYFYRYVYLTTCAYNLSSCGNVTKCQIDVTRPPAFWVGDHLNWKPDYNLEWPDQKLSSCHRWMWELGEVATTVLSCCWHELPSILSLLQPNLLIYCVEVILSNSNPIGTLHSQTNCLETTNSTTTLKLCRAHNPCASWPTVND